jgi:serine/threonine protein kinase
MLREYEVVKKIGQGSYGTVYKVKRRKDGKVACPD